MRQRNPAQVGLDHAHPRVTAKAPPQPGRQARVVLHGDHARSGGSQPGGNRAAARAEVEDQPSLARTRRADELGDQLAVTQEVGADQVRRQRPPPGHGGP